MAKYPCVVCGKDVTATKGDRYRMHSDDGDPCEMASAEVPEHVLAAGPAAGHRGPAQGLQEEGIMTEGPYPEESLGGDEDDGTMPESLATLRESVVGHRITHVEKGVQVPGRYYGTDTGMVITLDDGRKVTLADTSDCCAYTELDSFLLHADRIDHVITGVGTTGGYTTWHVYADMGDVLEMKVGWSSGNPFYYAYGFHIRVLEALDG